MAGVGSETSLSTIASSNPVPAKRPTIIRVPPKSGTTNNDEDTCNQSNAIEIETVAPDPQATDNSDAVKRRPPPARPTAGPSRQPAAPVPSARPASIHLRDPPPKVTSRLTPRPASVHLPLSQVPIIKDKPATASKPQKRRPEITIVSARPLSEVAGFSKDTCSVGAPQPQGKPSPSPTPQTRITTSSPATVENVSSAGDGDPGSVDAHQPVAAPRRGSDLHKGSHKPVHPSGESISAHPGDPGTTDMSGAPPPLPTNRPKGPYVPPPLPSTRPKGAYVHPGSVSSSSVTEGRANGRDHSEVNTEPTPVPKPRPRSYAADSGEAPEGGTEGAPSRPPQPVNQNHVSEETVKPPTPSAKPSFGQLSKPEPPNRPHAKLKSPSPEDRPTQAPEVHSKPKLPPHIPVKPAERPALPQSTAASRPAEKVPPPHPSAPPKPAQTQQAEAPLPPKPAMPILPPQASGTKYSRSDILSLFDTTFQKNSKPESGSNAKMKVAGAASTEDALRFGSFAASAAASDSSKSKNEVEALQFASAVAQNTSTQDVNNISGGVKMIGKSEDTRKAASSFTRIAKVTASDVRSSDSSSGDLKSQVAMSAAKNITKDDAKTFGKAGITIAKSDEGRKAASSIFNIARASMNQVNQSQSQNTSAPNPTARARPKNTGQQGGSTLSSLMGLMPPPKNPAQPAPKPPAAAGSKAVPKFKISESASGGSQRSKPTIIRPGADKPGSKPNSRSSSPEPKRKMPPPRPSTGPQGKSKGSAPPRPNAPSSQTKSATSSSNLKPKRRAPSKPGGQETKRLSQSESLPPRPGPGHPLYNKYMVSEPHGIALYDYKPIQPDELAFKANDTIFLLKRIDGDWLKGRCGNAEGLLPAAFLKIVKDIPQTNRSTSEPCAVAVYSFEGSAVDELSFQKDDNIVLLDRVGDQWYRGQCKGRTGIFPANHVKVIEELPVKSAASSFSSISGPRCKAKFDYSSSNPDDLAFKQGDVIQLVANMGSQWLKGQLNGKTGIFPESFVDIVEALPQAAAKKSPVVVNGSSGNKVTALFDFVAAESNEVSIKEGDKITVLSQVNAEWVYVEAPYGAKGNIPTAFVDHIPANLPSFTGNDSPSEIGECVVKFDFESTGEGELALRAGDRVTLLEHVGDDWLKGRLGFKEGIFPKTFVDIVSKGGAATMEPSLGTCKAQYDFIAEESDELTIVCGDVIEVLEYVSADWLKGRLHGKTGKFPKAFVDIR